MVQSYAEICSDVIWELLKGSGMPKNIILSPHAVRNLFMTPVRYWTACSEANDKGCFLSTIWEIYFSAFD
jgi:hypothetical protein